MVNAPRAAEEKAGNGKSSSPPYMEELALGERLDIGQFDEEAKSLCLLDGENAIFCDVESGNVEKILRHDQPLLGQAFYKGMAVTYTTTSQVLFWIGEQCARKELKLPDGYRPLWLYVAHGKHFVLAVDAQQQQGMDGDQADGSTLFHVLLEEVNFQNVREDKVRTKLMAQLRRRPAGRRLLTIGDGFYIRCEGKTLKMVGFGEEEEDSGESPQKHGKFQGQISREFTVCSEFRVDDPALVVFTEVHVAGDFVFAALSVGRVYAWSRVHSLGIGRANVVHLTLTCHRTMVCPSEEGTAVFLATGNAMLFKYNLMATSGIGRWHKLEYLQLDAPPSAMCLTGDATILAVILTDNSACLFQTAEMTPRARIQTLNTCQVQGGLSSKCRFGIESDPANEGLLIANARFGHVQFVDPFQWKTAKMLDVAEENIPHEDTFNLPNILWLNTYLVHASAQRIVTCECRRNDVEKTNLKFWRRPSALEFELEVCFVLPDRIAFLRSTLDECRGMAEAELDEREEFLCISASGKMDVYTGQGKGPGRNRASWYRDLARHWDNWQRTGMTSCSRIRPDRIFATINNLAPDLANVVLWDVAKMRVLRVLDTLQGPKQVEWSPRPEHFLLVACQAGLVAYSHEGNAFLWAIKQPGLTISSSRIATFAHTECQVYVLNPADGTAMGARMEFSRPHKQIVALRRGGHVAFCGINEEGSLSLLKPNVPMEMESESIDSKKRKKRTAFSQLRNVAKKAEEEEQPEQKQRLLKMVSIQKFIDGPAYTMPPTIQIAQRFIQACLRRKRRAGEAE